MNLPNFVIRLRESHRENGYERFAGESTQLLWRRKLVCLGTRGVSKYIQIGLVEAGLGIVVIPSFGVFTSRNRKVRITELEPPEPLDFQEIGNRGRKLSPGAIEFGAFLKTYIAE